MATEQLQPEGHELTTNTRPSFDRLRKQAKKLSKEAGISHCQALHLIAKNHGYKTWAALRVAYDKPSRAQL